MISFKNQDPVSYFDGLGPVYYFLLVRLPAVLVPVLVAVLIGVLVGILGLVCLILIGLILVTHNHFLRISLFRHLGREARIPEFSGFIPGLEYQTDKNSGGNSCRYAASGCF